MECYADLVSHPILAIPQTTTLMWFWWMTLRKMKAKTRLLFLESKDVSDFNVQLATRARVYPQISRVPLYLIVDLAECGYPSQLHALAAHIKQPEFPLAFSQFLYKCFHPDIQITPSTLEECPTFDGAIKVYHSAVATFYAPSDLSGSGGLRHEWIWSTPCFFGHPHRDTMFVITDDSQPGMEGMEIGRIQLLFSFQYRRKEFSCALINWFVHADEHNPDTGMWTVTQECNCHRKPTSEVIHIDLIAWVAHLLPILLHRQLLTS